MMTTTNPDYYQDKNGKDLFAHFREMFSTDEFRGYLKMNVIKYLYRYESKGGEEDLEKAKRYIEELIKLERTVAEVIED